MLLHEWIARLLYTLPILRTEGTSDGRKSFAPYKASTQTDTRSSAIKFALTDWQKLLILLGQVAIVAPVVG